VITGNSLTSTYGFGGGIGVWAADEVWVERSWIAENSSSYDGGGVAVRDGASGVLVNNVILSNTVETTELVGSGIALAADQDSWVINNTVVLNEGGYAQITSSWAQSAAYMANNIVAFSDQGGIGLPGGDMPSLVYSDLYGNDAGNYLGLVDVTGSNGNISADPLFLALTDDVDASNEDLHLQTGSPAIDAGHSNASFNDADGSRNDMGAYGGP
jgi:hypothetical protein